MAANDLRFLPEDTKPVCDNAGGEWPCDIVLDSVIDTSFIVGHRGGSKSPMQCECDFQISATVYEHCCDLPTGVRHSELPLDKDYLHHTATIFRGTDGGSRTQV